MKTVWKVYKLDYQANFNALYTFPNLEKLKIDLETYSFTCNAF